MSTLFVFAIIFAIGAIVSWIMFAGVFTFLQGDGVSNSNGVCADALPFWGSLIPSVAASIISAALFGMHYGKGGA